ncbi:MAG: cytochrome c family protein [Bacteroidetes bacterium]|nr:cytochrome c family protein [Bacteroidota bacterium]MBU1422611.1 cytochrome c family protein [Bacteroidota bacterium]
MGTEYGSLVYSGNTGYAGELSSVSVQLFYPLMDKLFLHSTIKFTVKREMFNKQAQGWNEEDRSAKIKFSHKLHVKDQGIDCSDCHTEATKSSLSSDKLFGGHSSCQTCHEEQIANRWKKHENKISFYNNIYIAILQKNLPEPTTPTVVHGRYLQAKQWNKDDCVQCHASNFEGGVSKVSCYKCHATYPHKTGFLTKNNPNYHGTILKNANWNLASCKTCHGQNFEGGNSGIKCGTCHESYPHAQGWTQTSNTKFHGRFLKSENWDLPSCIGCHGSNYDGGTITNVSCMTSNCHVDKFLAKKSPEACNTCHGDFTSWAELVPSWAPPKSVDGDTVKTVRGVGAHQNHLTKNTFGKTVKCQECYSVPTLTFTIGHLDTNLPAEVAMNDTIARTVTNEPATSDIVMVTSRMVIQLLVEHTGHIHFVAVIQTWLMQS